MISKYYSIKSTARQRIIAITHKLHRKKKFPIECQDQPQPVLASSQFDIGFTRLLIRKHVFNQGVILFNNPQWRTINECGLQVLKRICKRIFEKKQIISTTTA